MAGNPPLPDNPAPRKPFVKSFSCKNCGAAVTVKNNRDSVVAVCASCGSVIDIMDENYKILSQVKAKRKREPIIPLGSRGKLQGTLWEVIGYMTRRDVASNYSWEEYLLFNPYQGYRWLTQAQGHWNFVVMTKERPRLRNWGRKSAVYHDETYYLFYEGRAEVTYVLGEFYWRTGTGDTVQMLDYVDPPIMLSCEKDTSEQNWAWSQYTEPEEIQEAFKLKTPLPPRSGIAPNQPSGYSKELPQVLLLWGLTICILLAIQFFNVLTSQQNNIVSENTFTYSAPRGSYTTPPPQSFSTAPFKLEHGLSNVNVWMYAPVSNSWLYLDGELVNDDTGQSYPINTILEYYSGVDGGESWSEGSYARDILFSSIPNGTYHLDLDASGPSLSDAGGYVSIMPSVDFTVRVTRKVVNWANFWWSLLFVSLIPIFVWYRSHAMEVARWSESDFTPYTSEEE